MDGFLVEPENIQMLAQNIAKMLNKWGLDYRMLSWRTGTSPNSPLKIRLHESGDREVQYYPWKPDYIPEKVQEGLHLIAEDVRVHRPRVRLASGVRLSDVPLVNVFFTTNGVPSLRVLNPGTDLLHDERVIRQMLPLTDLLVLNLQELGFLYESLDVGDIEEIFRLGPKEVLVTEDVNGATLYIRNSLYLHQEAFQVHAVDPTGAGDSFLSHFLSARIKGEPSRDALRFAAAAAAAQTTMHGGSAVPPADMIDHLLREGTLHQRVETNAEAQ
ncbi:MAG: hypothetical protein HY976_01190 [Candidatus Kerfeldbacteria bacterium]|nr:hypothetical protein [Candidatus Kerfeldbacteria bacterium]